MEESFVFVPAITLDMAFGAGIRSSTLFADSI
jgi:hypothetical protein